MCRGTSILHRRLRWGYLSDVNLGLEPSAATTLPLRNVPPASLRIVLSPGCMAGDRCIAAPTEWSSTSQENPKIPDDALRVERTSEVRGRLSLVYSAIARAGTPTTASLSRRYALRPRRLR